MAVNELKNGIKVPTIEHTPWQLEYEDNWALTDKYIPHQAATPPTVTDDIDNGFDIGSRWVDTSTGFIYRCVDASTGAAVWIQDISATEEAVAGIINGADEDTAPSDTDQFTQTSASGTLYWTAWGTIKSLLTTLFDSLYAPISKGVDNGNNHDHIGGDGAAIDHGTLSNLGTGADHSYIDQDVTTISTPSFSGLAVGAAFLPAPLLFYVGGGIATDGRKDIILQAKDDELGSGGDINISAGTGPTGDGSIILNSLVLGIEAIFSTLRLSGVAEYADNTAAKAGGLVDGDIYRTGDVLKIVHS